MKFSVILILCLTLIGVYGYPYKNKDEDKQKFKLYQFINFLFLYDEPKNFEPYYYDPPIEITKESSTSTSSTSVKPQKNGTTFDIHNLVDVKENGCDTGYVKDPIGNCQQIVN